MPDFYINDFEHTRVNVNKATSDIIASIEHSGTEFREKVLEVARFVFSFSKETANSLSLGLWWFRVSLWWSWV